MNAKGEAFMHDYEPEWGDEADVPRIARAMAMENRKGNAPLYLDMSPIPEGMRDYFIQSKVRWMDYFFRKLGDEAKTDMFGKTPYYALNQMTKMGIRTGAGLPLRRAGAVVGGARAGRLRQPFRRLPHRALRRQRLDRRQIGDRGSRAAAARRRSIRPRCGRCTPKPSAPLKATAAAESDRILRDLQAVMFAYDTGILKREDRLQQAFDRVDRAVRGVQGHRRAAHPRAGAAEGDRGDAAGGALHPRRLALPHRIRG